MAQPPLRPEGAQKASDKAVRYTVVVPAVSTPVPLREASSLNNCTNRPALRLTIVQARSTHLEDRGLGFRSSCAVPSLLAFYIPASLVAGLVFTTSTNGTRVRIAERKHVCWTVQIPSEHAMAQFLAPSFSIASARSQMSVGKTRKTSAWVI